MDKESDLERPLGSKSRLDKLCKSYCLLSLSEIDKFLLDKDIHLICWYTSGSSSLANTIYSVNQLLRNRSLLCMASKPLQSSLILQLQCCRNLLDRAIWST